MKTLKSLQKKVTSTHLIIYLLCASLTMIGCSKEDNDPKEEVSGTFEFLDTGTHEFSIDASDIVATITIVGAGGGGGGGVDYNSGFSSTGGGGGGAAGEFKLLTNESLEGNVTYTVKVGVAGNGGSPSASGTNGQSSEISLEGLNLFIAMAGSGGLSNNINSRFGGPGGSGFPAGNSGTNGEQRDIFSFEALPGLGGNGGENDSLFGFGGDGGIGTELTGFSSTISAENGASGGNGYVKIEWTGLR